MTAPRPACQKFQCALSLASGLEVWLGRGNLRLAFALFTLAMIRDNLMLNVLMLVWPLAELRQ